MMRCCCSLGDGIQPCLRDYDRLQSIAVVLIYIQIGCALIGSLGALYNGVLLINLAIALFALVAIESSSQSLGRTYAVLLFCAILLDISWFILFANEIWTISSNDYGMYFILSVRLVLAMQIVGLFVRLSSSFLWIQIYRLGISHVESRVPREADFDVRTSFLSPSPAAARQTPEPDDVLGGSIYDPAYYSSLFEDGLENGLSNRSQVSSSGDDSSSAAAEASRIKLSLGNFFHSADVENPRSPVLNECSPVSKQQCLDPSAFSYPH